MKTAGKEIHYEGVHCNLQIHQPSDRVIVMRISGTDVGEFQEAPMKALDAWIADSDPIELFIDARDVRGASIAVSGDWAAWLSAQRPTLQSVTMLTGSRLIEVTAAFVRRFANLEGVMRIYDEPAVFDQALHNALR